MLNLNTTLHVSLSKTTRVRVLIAAFAFLVCVSAGMNVRAQGTEFTYQGSLKDSAASANGNYDFEFRLYDAVSGGSQVGSALGRNSVTVTNGIFSVSLDFASEFPGAPRFLEIKVRQTGGGVFTPLTPRQEVTNVPYSIKSASADNATNATNAGTATNAAQLGGVAANQYVQTGDARLSDARSPLPNSPNYIQNTNTAQTGNFNISGNGRVSTLFATGSGSNGGVNAQSNNTNSAVVATNSGGGYGIFAQSPTSFGVVASGVVGVWAISNNGGVAFQTSGSLDIQGGGFNGAELLRFSTERPWVFRQAYSGAGTALRLQPLTGLKNFEITAGGGANIATFVGNDASPLVGIGTTAPTQTLDVNGTLRVRVLVVAPPVASMCVDSSNNVVQCGASSLRWKTNVQSYSSGLDVIRRLRPISFNWKQDGSPDIGLGAEEVAKVAPSFALTNSKGEVEGVKYERLNILLINAVKEQQTQIEAQQKQIEQQLKQIESLTKIVCALNSKADICGK